MLSLMKTKDVILRIKQKSMKQVYGTINTILPLGFRYYFALLINFKKNG